MAATNFTPISLYYTTTAAAAPVAGNLVSGELAINITDGKLYYKNNAGVVTLLASTSGASGDVVGPASATDNALARFDLTTGKLIQNSVGILSDAGILTGLTGLTSSGSITLSSLTSGRVTYAGTAGLLQDSANLTFNGTTLTANTIGAYTLSGTIAGGGNQINNVIIGTTTPLAGSFTTINASTSITNAGLTSGRVTYAGTAGLLQDSANLTFNGTTLTAATGANFVTTSGSVGVGTASPQALLHVGAVAEAPGFGTTTQMCYVNGTSQPELLIRETTNDVVVSMYADSTSGSIRTATNHPLVFFTNNTDRMRITAAGTLTTVNDASVNGLTVGRGGGAVFNNTAVGTSALAANIAGNSNTAIGIQALTTNTSGSNNTASGLYAMYYNLSGSSNTANGASALQNNTSGSFNTASGMDALKQNLTASDNTAVGYQAGYSNTTGNSLTAVGFQAAYANIAGLQITAIGWQALKANTANYNSAFGSNSQRDNITGTANTSVGISSMLVNTAGSNNTAVGTDVLVSNTASNNTAVGYQAGYSNTTGTANVFLGLQTAYWNTTGSSNVSLGYGAFSSNNGSANGTGSFNVAVGRESLANNTTASNNTAVGYQAGYNLITSGENTAVGYQALFTNTASGDNVAVGRNALRLATGAGNTVIGEGGGNTITTGAKNTILGRYNGNQGNLDIRTASNYIVLSDGDGNPRLVYNSVGVGFLSGSDTATSIYVSAINQNVLGSYYSSNTDDNNFWINYNGYLDGQTRFRSFLVADGKGNTVLSVTGSTRVVKLNYGQLEFPATQNASANANTLDDYEEGTWTPTCNAGATLTLSGSPQYTKIGRQVTIHAEFSVSVNVSSTQFQISGLPFASNNSTGNSTGVTLGYFAVDIAGYLPSNASTITFQNLAASANKTNAEVSGNYFIIACTYFTA